MALDPNIALQVRPLQVDSPVNAYAQLAQLQQAQNQNALAQFQLESARRQDVAQNALNKAWQESITPEGKVDYNRLIGTLAAGGAGSQIPGVQKLRTEESKAATEEAARRAKLVVDKTAMYRDMVGNIASRDDAISWLQTQLSDPDMAGSPVTKVPLMQAVARIPADPAALEQWKTQQALGMTKFTELNKPHYITQNLGGTSRVSALPGLGGTPATVSETAVTMTPAERENLRVAQGNLNVAQGRLGIAQAEAERAASPEFQQRMAAAKATGEAIAKGDVAAIQQLPKVISRAEEGIRLIDELVGKRDVNGKLLKGSKPHPGFEGAVGATLLPGARFVPGTDAAGFMARYEQLKGASFLEAFESLKGGGAITEKEGEKATSAINRMNTSTDEKEFIKAATDLQEVIRKGVQNAQSRAAKTGTVAPAPAAAPAAGGVKFLGFE